MKKFKIGGKVTISEKESYRIVDIINRNGKIYYFACTDKKPITIIVFQRIEENGETFIKIEKNRNIIKQIAEIICNNSQDDKLTKTSKK